MPKKTPGLTHLPVRCAGQLNEKDYRPEFSTYPIFLRGDMAMFYVCRTVCSRSAEITLSGTWPRTFLIIPDGSPSTEAAVTDSDAEFRRNRLGFMVTHAEECRYNRGRTHLPTKYEFRLYCTACLRETIIYRDSVRPQFER
jgi:hypothetical protein